MTDLEKEFLARTEPAKASSELSPLEQEFLQKAAQKETQEQYGSGLQTVQAGVEGFARGITAGLVTPAQRGVAMGVEGIRSLVTGDEYDPSAVDYAMKGVAGRREANPVVSTASEITGVALPLILTAGGSAAAQGGIRGAMAATAPVGIARVGAGASRYAASAASTRGASQLTARAAGMTAAGAAEGAIYGAGQVVTEASLGNPVTLGEAAFTVGLGAGGGAAFGGLFGAVPRVAQAARTRWGKALREFEAERNLKSAGAIQNEVRNIRANYGGSKEALDELGIAMRDLELVGTTTSAKRTAAKAADLREKASRRITELLDEADQHIPPAAIPTTREITDWARQTLLPELRLNVPQKQAATKLDQLLRDYDKTYPGMLMPSHLHKIRVQLDDAIRGWKGTQDPWRDAYVESLGKLRGRVSELIREGIDAAAEARVPHSPGTFGFGDDGVALARWNKLSEWWASNRIYEVASHADFVARRAMDRVQGNNLLSLTEAMYGAAGMGTGGAIAASVGAGLGGGLVGTAASTLGAVALRRNSSSLLGAAARQVRTLIDDLADSHLYLRTQRDDLLALAGIERAKAGLFSRIGKSAKSLITPPAGTGAVVARMAAPASAKVAASIGISGEELRELASNPDRLVEGLARMTEDIAPAAPQTATAMQVTAARAISFLDSKYPRAPDRGPLAPRMEPSPAELARYRRYEAAVADPTGILDLAQAGTLTPEHVEAVQTVYPELYNEIVAALVDSMAEAQASGKTIPYASRRMLSMLLGSDVDGFGGIGARARSSAQGQPQAENPKATPARADRLKGSSRYETPMDRAATR